MYLYLSRSNRAEGRMRRVYIDRFLSKLRYIPLLYYPDRTCRIWFFHVTCQGFVEISCDTIYNRYVCYLVIVSAILCFIYIVCTAKIYVRIYSFFSGNKRDVITLIRSNRGIQYRCCFRCLFLYALRICYYPSFINGVQTRRRNNSPVLYWTSIANLPIISIHYSVDYPVYNNNRLWVSSV